MEKVLLVYEDYSELSPVETALQKTGFFTLGITNDYTVPEKLLSFNPDMVVVYGRAGKVKTSNVGRRLKELVKWRGKTVLIFHPTQRPEAHDIMSFRADIILESPVTIPQMVSVLARLSGQDDAPLLEKLNKVTATEKSQPAVASAEGTQGNNNTEVSSGSDSNKNTTSQMTFLKGSPQPESQTVQRTLESNLEKNEKATTSDDELSRLLTPVAEKKPVFQDPDLEAMLNASQASTSEKSSDVVAKQDLNVPSEVPAANVSLGNEPILDPGILNIQQDLIEAENKSAERQSRYQTFLAEKALPPPQQTQLRRVEARRAFKEMSKDWKKEEIKTQDEYRREFTRALFKKRD